MRQCCEASLKYLDVDYIDLYYQHRVDTLVPIEETVSDKIFVLLNLYNLFNFIYLMDGLYWF